MGIPYLLGTERLKGSHSMSCYHSTELCYLSAVYGNLLVNGQPMDFFFKPKPGGFKDKLLRVAPDILPPGSVRLEAVWIDGVRHDDFDAAQLLVRLPAADRDLRVRVRVVPVRLADRFFPALDVDKGVAKITMAGRLVAGEAFTFKAVVDQAVAQNPRRVVLLMNDLYHISPEGVRVLVFASEHLDPDVEIYGIGATPEIVEAFREMDLDEDIIWLGDYDAARIERS